MSAADHRVEFSDADADRASRTEQTCDPNARPQRILHRASRIIDALENVVDGVELLQAPLIITRLAGVQSKIAARLMNSAPSVAEPDECLTLAELAERVKIGESTLRTMIASGQLHQGEHYTRKGRRLLFFWLAIETWLRQPPEITSAARPAVTPFIRRGRRHD